MQAITIQPSNERTLKLIKDLEELELLKIISTPNSSSSKKKKSLSNILSGSISKKEADDLNAQVKKMRSEWERNI